MAYGVGCMSPKETALCQSVIRHLTQLQVHGRQKRLERTSSPAPAPPPTAWVDPNSVPPVAILVVSRNRPDLATATMAQLRRVVQTPHDVYLVECGTERDKLIPESTLVYHDPGFATGKAWCHRLAFEYAKLRGRYRYFWLMMNDLVLEEDKGCSP